jgi:hypothetical protein
LDRAFYQEKYFMKAPLYAAFILALVATFSAVLAQSPPPSESPPTAEKKEPSTANERKDGDNSAPGGQLKLAPAGRSQLQPGYGHDATVDRRLAAFVRLRDEIFEKVKLDAEKRKKIDGMFDDYMAGLLNPEQRPHLQPRPEDVATPQELPELKKQLEEAEKGSDREKIATLKAKIYAANIALEPSVIDEPVFFFDYVRKELSEEEQKQFDPVLNRWRLLRVAEIAPDNDFKRIRRAVRDPLLVDSEELKKELDALIIEAIRTIPLGQKRLDKGVMAELAVATKPKVLEKLNPKQREHFEKTVEMLERWEKEEPEIAKKTRDRLKDHRVSQQGTDTAPKPTQGSGDQP